MKIIKTIWNKWEKVIGFILSPVFRIKLPVDDQSSCHPEQHPCHPELDSGSIILNSLKKRKLLIITSLFLLFTIPVVILGLIYLPKAEAVGWWPDGGNMWTQRKQLTVTNNSAANLSSGTTVAITIDTSALVSAGKLQSDCDDLRVLYQPSSSTTTEVTRHLMYPTGTTCSTSTTTKVYFKLQTALNTAISTTDYYAYYNNSGASTPSSTDNAFDVGSADATLVCPFDGSTTCAAGETPSTESGAVRYSGTKGALSFDGNSDYVTAANITAYSAFTAEAWVKINPNSSAKQGILSNGTGSFATKLINIYIQSGTLQAYFSDSSSSACGGNVTLKIINSGVNIRDGSWHHVAQVFDGTTMKLYLDGTSRGTPVTKSNYICNTGAFRVGITDALAYDYASYYTDGIIDEVRVSNNARYTSNFTPQTMPFMRDSNVKFLFHFDENGDDPRNTGKTIDDSGNGNHGTITGAKYVSGMVGVDGSDTTNTGNLSNQSYAKHEGIFIEEGTTNKITNPSFENATAYDTNWSSNGLSTWWTAGGATGVVAAYNPVAATDLADSYINDANPGTYNAAPGTAPTWATGTGWTFTSASSQYLTTGIVHDTGWSIIARWTGATLADSVAIGSQDTGNTRLLVGPYYSTGAVYGAGGAKLVAPGLATGVLAVAGQTAYRNGITESGDIGAWSGTNSRAIFIGADNAIGSPAYYLNGSIQAAAVYNTSLSAAQILAITNSMNTLGLTVTSNTTAPYYKFGSKSTKIVASGDGTFTTAINAGNTNSHTLSAYVYNGTAAAVGGTVDATVAKLVFNGAAQTTTYTDMVGGWWRLTYSAAGIASSQSFGVQVLSGKTVYVDGIQLEEKAYATTYTDGTSGTGYAWTGTAHDSTSTRTVIGLQYTNSTNVSDSAGSVSFWLKPNRIPSSWWSTSAWVARSDWDRSLYISGWTSRLDARFGISPDWKSLNVNNAFTAGKWTMVTLTWDINTDQVALYANTTSDTDTYTGAAPGLDTNMTFGAPDSGNMVSDLRIFNTALTSTQVTDLYQAGLVAHREGNELDREGGFDTKGEPPVAIWHMDEGYGTTTYDSTINANHLTLGTGSSAPTWNVDSGSGSGMTVGKRTLRFDGSNDYLSRSTDGDFDFGTGSFTISGSFRHPSTITGTDTILARYGSAGYKVYMNSSGYVCFATDYDSTWSPTDFVCSTVSFADSKWHTFSAVKNGTTSLTLYIDGNSVGTPDTSLTASSINTGSNLYIGIDSDASSNPWDGFLDEVVVYPYARSASQVKTDLYGNQTSVVLGAQTKDNLSDGLVGHWKMDETATPSLDSSGNGNSGTWANNTTSATGKFGNTVTLDGTDDYVDLGTTPTMASRTAVTLSAWINADAFTTTPAIYVENTSSAGNTRIGLYINTSGKLQLAFRDSSNDPTGTATVITGDTTLSANTWYHVVGVYDSVNDIHRVYVNGQIDKTDTTAVGALGSSGTNCIEIGILCDNNTANDFDGEIDEARVYNRALSPAEVSQLYNFAPGPVGYWKMDENTGGYAYDISGNSNTGTLGTGSSAPTWTNAKFGVGLSFDGSNDYVDIGNITALNYERTQPISLSGWINSSSVSTQQWFFGKMIGSGNYTGYGCKLYQSKLDCYVRSTLTNAVNVRSTTALSSNQWYHIEFTYDGSSLASGAKMYINGVLDTPVVAQNNLSTSSQSNAPFRIGALGTENIVPFLGKIDDVKIYNYARNAKQIIEDMNGGHPSVGSPVGSAVGYWKFDEGQGQTINNSGNSESILNGTLGANSSSNTDDPSWSNSGKFGKTLSFDGGDHMAVQYSNTLDLKSTISASAWVYLTATNAADSAIFGRGSGSYYFTIDSNRKPRVFFYGTSPEAWFTANNAISLNTWTHVAFTYDGINLKIFINGKLDNSQSRTGGITGNTNVLPIGSIATTGTSVDISRAFDGYLDEVKIYNYGLTADEVKLDYNKGSSIVLGSISTDSDGTTASNADSRGYCVPGDTTSCAAPVAEWNFSEGTGQSANDTSGNNNTGTLGTGSSAPSWTSNGKLGNALSFDGGNDYVSAAHASSLAPTALTTEMWIKPSTTLQSGVYAPFIRKDGNDINNTGAGYNMIYYNGSFISYFNTDGDSSWDCYTSYATTFTANQWYHIAFAKSSSGLTYYINGAQVVNNTTADCLANINYLSTTNSLYIGYAYGTVISNQYFPGVMDNVRVFNYARTPAQIAWDYNRGGPVGHWRMDDCNGGTTIDSSGNGNTGTLYPVTLGNTTTGTCASGTTTEMWNDGTNGKFNASLGFDGSDDYVSMGDVNSLEPTFNGFSVSAWAMASDWPTAIQVITGKYNTGTTTTFYLGAYQDKARGVITGTGGSKASNSLNDLIDGQWQHLTMTWSGTTTDPVLIYVNGNLNSSTEANATITAFPSTSEPNMIGSRQVGTAAFFSGQIDDVRIYNYALTPLQIKTVFNSGSAVRFGPSTGTP